MFGLSLPSLVNMTTLYYICSDSAIQYLPVHCRTVFTIRLPACLQITYSALSTYPACWIIKDLFCFLYLLRSPCILLCLPNYGRFTRSLRLSPMYLSLPTSLPSGLRKTFLLFCCPQRILPACLPV